MSYRQLVTPNLDISYRGGWCQRANENTVGQTGIYGSAYQAWLANTQHTELPPAGHYVPVYLNLPNGPRDYDGTQLDDVAISCPDGSVAAAAKNGTHRPLFRYASLQAYINDYARNNGGATYRGWGEFIGTVRVVALEEEDMKIPDTDEWFEHSRKLVKSITGTDLTRDVFRRDFVGNSETDTTDALLNDPAASQRKFFADYGREAYISDWPGQIQLWTDYATKLSKGDSVDSALVENAVKQAQEALDAAKALKEAK